MNEVHVDLDELGRVRLRRAGEGSGVYTLETTEALRAFFQAERDEQLGWWRDPENPNIVVYRTPEDDDEDGRCVRVLDEHSGEFWLGWEHTASPGPARRYFDAHPEPKPWHAARPDCDEIWVLTIHGCEQPVYVTEFGGEPAFQVPGGETMSLSHGAITAGHRIWPEPRIGGAE